MKEQIVNIVTDSKYGYVYSHAFKTWRKCCSIEIHKRVKVICDINIRNMIYVNVSTTSCDNHACNHINKILLRFII